jgi:hypothetical protein
VAQALDVELMVQENQFSSVRFNTSLCYKPAVHSFIQIEIIALDRYGRMVVGNEKPEVKFFPQKTSPTSV